jgi:hypothetical protein
MHAIRKLRESGHATVADYEKLEGSRARALLPTPVGRFRGVLEASSVKR